MSQIAKFFAWLKRVNRPAHAPHIALIIDAADKIVGASQRIEQSADRFDAFGTMTREMTGKRTSRAPCRKPAKKRGSRKSC